MALVQPADSARINPDVSASPVRIQPPQVSRKGDEVIRLDELLASEQAEPEPVAPSAHDRIIELGGRRDGPDPTRYGDWEKNGRCIDF